MDISDAELVKECLAGNHGAWETIVRQYTQRIYNLAYRFTGRFDEAEDLTQEVFVRVYRSLDQYDPKQGDLQNWLMRLARNLIIDDYRKRQREKRFHISHERGASCHAKRCIARFFEGSRNKFDPIW